MSGASVHQITDKLVEEFRAKKLLREMNAEIELDPVAGSRIIGELTSSEAVVFTEMICLDAEIREHGKELLARASDAMGQIIRRSDSPEDVTEAMQHYRLFTESQEAEAFFGEQTRYNYLKGLFWHTVRERLQTFASILEVRAGFKVVHLGLKYKE